MSDEKHKPKLPRKHNKWLVPFAKALRKDMTKEEKHLWYDFLRMYPIKFTRQKVLGEYIADFYSAEAGIVIELDGSQHFDPKAREADEVRDSSLSSVGIKVIRYTNGDVNRNFEGVVTDIMRMISVNFKDLKKR